LTASSASTATVLSLIADDMREVDRSSPSGSIRRAAGGQVSRYIISAGGKRLRPALLLLVCGALGYRGEQRFNLAAVVEFIHTATLLHDDVVDESTLRAAAPPPTRTSATRPACWSATSSTRAPSR
jgi:octaprenyl-diphosphate synthase